MTLFDDIVQAINAEFKTPIQSILSKGGQKGLTCREILCFIVEHDYKKLRNEVAKYLSVAPIAVVLMSRTLIERLNGGGRFLVSVNRVRKRVGLPVFKPSVYKNKRLRKDVNMQTKKNLNKHFVDVKFTKAEEQALKNAMQSSVFFFEKYGQGRKPKFMSEI